MSDMTPVPRIFGWTPEPDDLLTLHGIDAAITALRLVRVELWQRKQATRDSRLRERCGEELVRLASLERDIKERKRELHDLADGGADRFGKMFRRCVADRFGREVHAELIAATHARIAEQDATRSTVANARALEPISGGGGMRTRR